MKFFLTLLFGALLGCEPALETREPTEPHDPLRKQVELWIPDFSDDLLERFDQHVSGEAITNLAAKEAARPWNARIRDGLKYADLLVELYDGAPPPKVFASGLTLTPKGTAVLDVLKTHEFHGLVEDDYHVARIEELLNGAGSQKHPHAFAMSGEDVEVVLKWLRTNDLDIKEGQPKLLDAVILGNDSPFSNITEQLAELRGQRVKGAAESAELELRLSDGALRFSRDLKHFNLVRLDWREIRDGGGSKEIIYERLRKTFAQLVSREDVNKVFEELWPPHPQYARLLDARKRYLEIAAAGGWNSVRPISIKIGARGAQIKELRTRLAIEGYLTNNGSERVDQELIDAIHTYQRTHQFTESIPPSAGFWRSLNTTAERRLEQIERSIQRWRESRYDGEPNYVFVNIPDFHANVYEDHELQMRFRVVVGNNKRRCDPETSRWVYPDATPTQLAFMDHVEVNPFWNVPERIVQEEFQKEIDRDPDWLEKNHYELVETKKNSWVRQKPGAHNALGMVKFIFPNRHNTYMHDTPKKKYFDYPIRAFSHGCVRVSEPIEFAKYLLTREAHTTPAELQQLFESEVTRRFYLKEKIPVFFEYYVVQVDEDGHTHFLSDIYRKDQRRSSDNPEEFDNCTVKRAVTTDDEDWNAPQSTGADYGP